MDVPFRVLLHVERVSLRVMPSPFCERLEMLFSIAGGDVSDTGTPQPSSPFTKSSPHSSPFLDRRSEVSSEGSPIMIKKETDVSIYNTVASLHINNCQ